MVRDLIAAIRSAAVLTGQPVGGDFVTRKPRLGAEHTPGSALAVQTMAHRNPNGLTNSYESELPAAAGGASAYQSIPPFLVLMVSLVVAGSSLRGHQGA